MTILLTAGAQSQSQLPRDIHPESLSRLPQVQRAGLDADGQRIYNALAGAGTVLTRTGPAAVTMHSPKAPEPIYAQIKRIVSRTVTHRRLKAGAG